MRQFKSLRVLNREQLRKVTGGGFGGDGCSSCEGPDGGNYGCYQSGENPCRCLFDPSGKKNCQPGGS